MRDESEEQDFKTSGRSRRVRLCEICGEPLTPDEAEFGGRRCDSCQATAARMLRD
jgi:hypothetical protein